MITEPELRDTLARYFDLLQRHASADEMLAEIVTDDFETGFADGLRWCGVDGLADFLAARAGFVDERHELQEVLGLEALSDVEAEARTRLEFFLRQPGSSDEFTGTVFHTWRLRSTAGEWRVAAQIVDGFAHLNDNAARLFSAPEDGLTR
jgi:hypothetical protein